MVDSASRDATLEIARRDCRRRRGPGLRRLRRPAERRAGPGFGRLGAVGGRRRADHPALAAEIRRVIADPDAPYHGYRVPIRSEILGRRFGFSGTQHDLPLRLFRRDSGRWVGLVHETVDLRGAAGTVRNPLRHRTIPTMWAFLEKIDTLHDARGRGAGRGASGLSDGRPDAAAGLDVLQALCAQARIPRRRRGVHVLPVLGRVGRGAGLEAPRADPGEEGP